MLSGIKILTTEKSGMLNKAPIKNPYPIICPLPVANAWDRLPLWDFSEINEKNGGQKKPTRIPCKNTPAPKKYKFRIVSENQYKKYANVRPTEPINTKRFLEA